MKIAIASDHGGFLLKREIIQADDIYFDCGVFDEEPADYPDYAKIVANYVLEGKAKFGILICKSGIGMSICANRFSGIRAALCFDEEQVRMAREHNDVNVLVLAANRTNSELANRMIDIMINTGFAGGRHLKRVAKIDKLKEN
jgi:ribose 5-phosphate isomerase B